MKRIAKSKTSPIVLNNWRYPTHRTKILEQLEIEQSHYCAYTEYKLETGFARDVEHFNPNLKKTAKDSYENWYAVGHRWNNKIKKLNWFYPCYSLRSKEIGTAFAYKNGYYVYDIKDTKADNLARMIGLNEPTLVDARVDFIESLNYLQNNSIDLRDYFKNYPDNVKFRTAIKTVFGFMPK